MLLLHQKMPKKINLKIRTNLPISKRSVPTQQKPKKKANRRIWIRQNKSQILTTACKIWNLLRRLWAIGDPLLQSTLTALISSICTSLSRKSTQRPSVTRLDNSFSTLSPWPSTTIWRWSLSVRIPTLKRMRPWECPFRCQKVREYLPVSAQSIVPSKTIPMLTLKDPVLRTEIWPAGPNRGSFYSMRSSQCDRENLIRTKKWGGRNLRST